MKRTLINVSSNRCAYKVQTFQTKRNETNSNAMFLHLQRRLRDANYMRSMFHYTKNATNSNKTGQLKSVSSVFVRIQRMSQSFVWRLRSWRFMIFHAFLYSFFCSLSLSFDIYIYIYLAHTNAIYTLIIT